MTDETPKNYKRNYRSQIIGMFAGGGLGLMVFALFPAIQTSLDLFTTVIGGAVLGVVLFNLDQLDAAGRIITRKETRWLNVSVAIIIPLLILIVFAIIFR